MIYVSVENVSLQPELLAKKSKHTIEYIIIRDKLTNLEINVAQRLLKAQFPDFI